MPKTALFLGAGASRAFGYPTTLEFVNELKDVLKPLEKTILNSILKSPKVSDIEHVLQKLDPIINPESIDYLGGVLKGSSISTQIFGTEVKWETFISSCQKLKQSIIAELYSQYEFNRTKLDEIIKCFTALGSILCDVNQLKELHVFTTNYDSVIENYCIYCDKQMEFTCGFRTDRRSGRHFWYPEELKKWDRSKRAGRIRLYKLHGSLDWRETADGRIERVPTEERISPRTRRYKRNIIIYPAQKNYAVEEPFRRLQKYLENVLSQHDLCLVIGFSFRDPLVNNTFLDFLGVNNKRRLVISPHAIRDVEENLTIGEPKLRKQITSLNMRFGEEDTFRAIEEALQLKKTEQPQ